MATHIHQVSDPDPHFIINPETREITTEQEDLILIQGDHNSEIYTFEIPRYVEGHDMSLCSRIEIHTININKQNKKETSKDVYLVDDAQIENDNLVFSWLINHTCTKYYGVLNFLILFLCTDENGDYTYKWNTEFCKNLITIGEGSDNTESITEEYPDILQKFKNEILAEMAQLRFTRYLEDVVKYATSGSGLICFRIESPLDRNENEIADKWFDIEHSSRMTYIQVNGEDGALLTRQAIGTIRKIKFNTDTSTKKIFFDAIFGSGAMARYLVNDDKIEKIQTQLYTVREVDKLVSDAKALGLSSATVGQTVRVKAVDSSGKPTEWESVDEITPDYEENDPTSMNYIKNRPFYEDAVFQCELTPDMDVSQMETIRTDVGLPYVYISDTVIPEGTYAPAAVITGTDGEEQKDVRSPIQLEYNEDGVSYFGGIFILVNRDTEINGISAKKGIYVISPTAFTPVASGNLTAVLKIEIIKDIDRPFLSNVYDELDEKMGKNDPTGTGTFSMNDSKATGECSFTEGTGNIASGYSSHAEGYCTKASKGYSHAEGYGTTASGECSHAEGYYTTASGYSSHAEGAHAKPSGEYSHAEGYGTTASGKRSHSEGYYTIASGDCSHVMGKYNVEDTKNKYAFIIGGGSGTSNSKRKNIYAVDWNGNSYSGGTLYVNANANGENGSEVATKEYVEQNMSMRLDFYIGNYGYIYYTGTTDSFATILANPQRYPTATFGQPDKTIKFDGLLTLSEVGSDYIIYDRTYVENNEVKRDYVKFKSNNNDANKTTYGTETIGYLNAQADWDEQNEEAQGYIKNKPSLEPIVVVYTHTYNDVNFTLCGVKPSEVTYSEMCELLNENAPFLINVNHKPVLYWDFEQNQSTGKYTFTYYSVGSDAGEIKLMGSSVSGIPFKDESTNTSTNTSTSTSTSTST